MDTFAAIIVVSVLFVLLAVFFFIAVFNCEKTAREDEIREAGEFGEHKASAAIKKVLKDGDYLFRNVEFSYENRKAELDCVVVNRYGVFITEVKNYVGELSGKEDDGVWKKYKYKRNGIYVKTVKNPIHQVKRQVYLLSKYLKSNGINVWVKGHAILVNGNSPVKSEYILSNIDEIDKVIHTQDKKMLSEDTVERIRAVLG